MRSSASLATLALLLTACADARAGIHDETGAASWYGDELAGRPTASGAPFNPDAITVAHRTLPLGAFVEVTSLDSGRTIVAMVGDRGPFHDDRLVDLSLGAARQLGTTRPLSRVRVRVTDASPGEAAALRAGRPAPVRIAGTSIAVAMPVPVSASQRYLVRVGTFSSRPRAAALADALGAALIPAGGLWRVVLGPYTGAAAAQQARDGVVQRGYGDAVILAQP